MLTKELTYYHPTILCLQEVDLEQYGLYFTKLLHSLRYDHVLLAAKKKRQGLLIAWDDAKYKLIHRKNIHYDRLSVGSVGPTMWTGNVGIALGLQRKDKPDKGLWVANTHLYWHPRGSYERHRQASLFVSETVNFAARESTWPVFICGGIPSVNVD
jgi:RNA exonuclease NGL2